jgi:plastocyanin
MNGLWPILAGSALLLAGACGRQQEGTNAANARHVDQSKAAAVSGRVVIEGHVPANPPIQIDADPYCAQQNPNGATSESFVVDNGGLENVFVYVKDTFGDYRFDVPSAAAKLDQKSCRYTPHVLGVRVGQKLAVSNSDDTMHNIHATGDNGDWTKSEPLKNMVQEKTFTRREVMVPFKCDVHNWMHAYVGVMDHPYFAVTHDGGRFELKNLPAGTYTVEAWHEKLGTASQHVTVGEKETKEIAFTFRAPAAGAN